jgi:glycosyltransferase involved in cell wall biosynthesis
MAYEVRDIDRVLALIDTYQVSGPTRGLFQIVEGVQDTKFRIVPAMFLRGEQKRSPAIQEAERRGFPIGLLHQRSRFDRFLIAQAVRLIRDHNISIIQSHSYKPAFIAWRLKELTGLPWVAFSHGYTNGNASLIAFNALDRWLMRKADRIIVVSHALRNLLSKSGVSADRMHVVHNCIDPGEHALDASKLEFRNKILAAPNELLVGVIGRFSKEKGHSVFMRAFQQVVRAVPEAKGVLIGDGPESLRIRMQAKSLGLEDRIIFAGYHQNISTVYAALDLVVIPSLSEGLPNVLLESLLHRRAVVATAVGGIPEIADPSWSKWLVPSGDPIALSRAIVEALRSPLVRHECGVKGEQYVRNNFPPSKRVRQVLDVYRSLDGKQEHALQRNVSWGSQ